MFPGAPSRRGPRPHHLQMPSTSSKPPQTPLPTNLQLNATYPSPHPTRPGILKAIEPNIFSSESLNKWSKEVTLTPHPFLGHLELWYKDKTPLKNHPSID